MRAWMLPLVLVFSALAGGEPANAAPDSAVIDRPVRFVNDRVLTIGDIRTRNGVRVEQYRRNGRVLPDSREGLLRFYRDTLEELTDEELLVQKADELQVAIDRDRLSSDVIAEARQRGLSLRDIALLRQVRSREAKVDSVLGWFESRSANTSPTELRAAYDARAKDWARPPRARTLLIALRPTADDERKDLVKALAGLMREAQQDADAAIVAAAASRLDAFLAADSAGQPAILAQVATDIAALAGTDGLAKPSAALVQRAGELQRRWQAVRSRDECERILADLHTALAQLPADQRADRFREQARAISQGPQASEGGLLGWVEPGTFGKEIEEQALAMPALEPSAPFWTGGAAAMTLVLEREEGRTQSFAEVSAALQASLDRERRAQVRQRISAVLRQQASIRDVVDLGTALR
ncbi:MAG: peptidylprolyl isomerase [Planctomycetes bacterium]|nr:peptidylprolyl isomerase [Planctomycetota bacterium]